MVDYNANSLGAKAFFEYGIRACLTPFYAPFEPTICLQKPLSATEIPQRTYCQRSAIPGGAHPRQIMFATVDCSAFPLLLLQGRVSPWWTRPVKFHGADSNNQPANRGI